MNEHYIVEDLITAYLTKPQVDIMTRLRKASLKVKKDLLTDLIKDYIDETRNPYLEPHLFLEFKKRYIVLLEAGVETTLIPVEFKMWREEYNQ